MSINLSGATISMNYQEFDALLREVKNLQKQIIELETKQATIAHEGINDALAKAVQTAIPIVQFAVASLDPRTVREWPWKRLKEFAEALKQACPRDPNRVSLADTLCVFANECAQIDRYRVQRHQDALDLISAPEPDPVEPDAESAPARSAEAVEAAARSAEADVSTLP